ncbi:E4 ORFC [Skunk adenovirus HUN/2009]|nr:E4 ORFC [Skunk adenovirus HUN/2009]
MCHFLFMLIGIMASADDNNCTKCMCFSVKFQHDLSVKLLEMEPELGPLMQKGLETFLTHWLNHVYVFNHSKPGNLALFFCVCFNYLEPTQALVSTIINGAENYLNTFLKDYTSAKDVEWTSADSSKFDVVFIPRL